MGSGVIDRLLTDQSADATAVRQGGVPNRLNKHDLLARLAGGQKKCWAGTEGSQSCLTTSSSATVACAADRVPGRGPDDTAPRMGGDAGELADAVLARQARGDAPRP
jgi:hypothetical protein